MRHRVDRISRDKVEITLLMDTVESRQFMRVLRVASELSQISSDEKRRWGRLSKSLRKAITGPSLRYMKVNRPPGHETNELDIDHVVNGSHPYPVLSVKDMETAWKRLETKGHSAGDIADRLYVAVRSVHRWRKRAREKAKET